MRRKSWRDSEDRAAELAGGRCQPASGARWHSKGDVKSLNWLVEVKATDAKQYTLKLADLVANEAHAAQYDRDPVFMVVFHSKTGQKIAYKIERMWDF